MTLFIWIQWLLYALTILSISAVPYAVVRIEAAKTDQEGAGYLMVLLFVLLPAALALPALGIFAMPYLHSTVTP